MASKTIMSAKQDEEAQNCKSNVDDIHQQVAAFERWKVLGYIFPFTKGIVYPLFKISMIALASELLRNVLQFTLDSTLFEQIDTELFGNVRDSPVTSMYLMESLTFYQILGVVLLYIVIVSIVQPIHNGLSENYNCYMEVKRLQMILHDKFILEPNSVAVKEAMELAYSHMNSIQHYWSESKYGVVDDCTSAIWSLILVLILSWDLGLIITVGTTIIMVGKRVIWNKLSTPWSQQREIKMANANARLMDLVVCKDVVLSHTMEEHERTKLQQAVYSDSAEINHLFWAETISKFIQYITFTFVMPSLFIYVREVDLTLERVFQLLLLVVIQDEMVRAYLSFANHGPIIEEGTRAKQAFARVLGVDQDELFPSEFACVTRLFSNICCSKKEQIGQGTAHEMHHISENNLDDAPEPRPTNMDKTGWLGCKTSTGLDLTKIDESELLQSDISAADTAEGKYSLQEVSIGYWRHDGSFQMVLKEISLDLTIGGHYAVMGETGAGKSTLFKAIGGLIPMQKGRFLVDGTEVDATCQSWRKQLGVVSQDSVLLNRTLRENLTYGIMSGSMTDDHVYEALKKVNLKKIVDELPQGLDTPIRENGNEFSGGQRQRIQIARLLLSDCPIILLDEMTSALDSETERLILEVLADFLKGKTLIMVTHDVQTLTLADTILEMQIGKPIVIKGIGGNMPSV